MSSSSQAGIRTLVDALASTSPTSGARPLVDRDTNRPLRLIELAVLQARLDAELARLSTRRAAHTVLTTARRAGTPQERLFSEVDAVLTSVTDELPAATPVTPAPRQSIS